MLSARSLRTSRPNFAACLASPFTNPYHMLAGDSPLIHPQIVCIMSAHDPPISPEFPTQQPMQVDFISPIFQEPQSSFKVAFATLLAQKTVHRPSICLPSIKRDSPVLFSSARPPYCTATYTNQPIRVSTKLPQLRHQILRAHNQ